MPFRSVASRLIKGLSASAREIFQLDVLRPPTFEQLARVLRAARDGGQPYNVVHFDGHGVYTDAGKSAKLSEMLGNLSHLLLSGQGAGAHGFLLFENPAQEKNAQLVDGSTLGKLLVETHVPVLVLNACRSAHTDTQTEPTVVQSSEDPHAKIRAFGSLAHEVMDAGVAGVVAMRYNVYVVTAAQFVAELYASLTRGHMLGDAVTIGRKQLAAQPLREIAYDPLALQDWPVPVVYEAAPIALFQKATAEKTLSINLSEAEATPVRGALDAKLPPSPDAGFFGRDETLLALDRAFDTQSIVLLHAYAGNGKTATAAEFARWYSLTGGVDGPVLYTSFEQYKPLARLLDQIGQVFGPWLERVGVNWLALSDTQRSGVALQVLKQIPTLWIWDNVEPVAGFPAGAQSSWSAAEQKELADFLRAARDTKAKFLLTSRRDERGWLNDLPARATLPKMPMQERVQLARALAEKHGRRLIDVDDWRPLLEFTQGNPMTIAVLVGQALRDGFKTKEQIATFVQKLRSGEGVFEDEADEGRSKSLGASLSYGFDNAFSKEERKQLALLHFFQGFVDVDIFLLMGYPKADWCLPEVRGLTRNSGIALLDRAAEAGLLTSHGNGYYAIHPAVPWFLKTLFEDSYADSDTRAAYAFASAVSAVGENLAREVVSGKSELIDLLAALEATLLYARQMAQANGWWESLISTMQGLFMLYDHTGRWAEWKLLVDVVAPAIVDPATGDPLPGREEVWRFVNDYRMRVAFEARQWPEAERLQSARVEWSRKRALAALASPADGLDAENRSLIRSLGAALCELGLIQREMGDAKCVSTMQEAIALVQRVGNKATEALNNLNLGVAYLTLPSLYDLSKAESCFQHGLDLTPESDKFTSSKFLSELGYIALERFLQGREAKEADEVLSTHLNNAFQFYQRALALTPPDAIASLAVKHSALGGIYSEAGDLENALIHWREAIRYKETLGDLYDAARSRYAIAEALANVGRFADARDYADAALSNFETYRATDWIQKTRGLIEWIEQQTQGG